MKRHAAIDYSALNMMENFMRKISLAIMSAGLAIITAAPVLAAPQMKCPEMKATCQHGCMKPASVSSQTAAVGFATGQRGVRLGGEGTHCHMQVDTRKMAIQFATGQRGPVPTKAHVAMKACQ